MPLVEIKDFNALIGNKLFFDQPVKNKQETYKKLKLKCQKLMTRQQEIYQIFHIIQIIINTQYYKFTNIPQQINFTGKLEEDNGAAMFFIVEKQQKTILNFSLDSLTVTE